MKQTSRILNPLVRGKYSSRQITECVKRLIPRARDSDFLISLPIETPFLSPARKSGWQEE